MAAERRLVTYLDRDPIIQYLPSLDDPGSTLGWLSSFPSTKNSSSPHPEFPFGVGDSTRITGSVGASMSFSFYGSSALIYGSAKNIRYNVQVDDLPAQELTESDGVVASIAGLEPALHTVKLTVLETRGFTFSFDRVEFDIGMRGDWKNSTYPARLGASGWTFKDDESWPWTNLTSEWPDGSGRTDDNVFTRALGAKASFQFKGSAIYIRGNTLPDHGRIKFTLESPDRPITTAIYQGRTKFYTMGALVYFQAGLNSSHTHILTMENLDDAYIDFARAIVATGEERHPGHASSKTNVGVIVGSVLGAIACLLALFGFIFFIRQHRRTRGSTLPIAHRTATEVIREVKPASPTSYTTPISQSYTTDDAPGSLDLEQASVQPYVAHPLHAAPAHHAESATEEKSLKRLMMLRQQERADRIAEVTLPAYTEQPR